MKCQNCGFESADTICSVCGAEIIDTIDTKEKTQENQILSNNDESKTEDAQIKKPKRRFKKILIFLLIIILSIVVVSASSIAVFYYCTNDSRTSFYKINQAVNCGDFSVKLKEVKTPEFNLEYYYPQIVYDLVFEFHNNTSQTLTLDRPEISSLFMDDGADSGYIDCDYYTYYDVNGKKNLSVSFEIPAWSSVEFIERVYYEDYSDDFSSFVPSSMQDSVEANADDDGVIAVYNSAEDDENGGDDSGEDDGGKDVVIIDESRIKYKKESLQKYKDNSPGSFYLIVAEREFLSDEEKQYARFFVEPDKEAIVISEGDNIE